MDDRIGLLTSKGVELIDPRQIFVGDDVLLDQIFPGSILFPGTRLLGAKTIIAPGARIGSEGPATIVDSAIGENAEVASGFVSGSVLLDGARVGSNGHVRAGCLLEEEASTAHAVGLKHTVLTSFVTLGSLINCCDCLISGGRSRSNHTEIGSGFIHFNFTPWGESGDKATPSLIGDVPRGVFLREEKSFIGGLSGIVGPNRIGFGSFTVAGQVIRSDIPDNKIRSEVSRSIDAAWNFQQPGPIAPRIESTLEYIGQLIALRAWYSDVRKRRLAAERASAYQGMTIDVAIGVIDSSIDERLTRLRQLTGQHTLQSIRLPAIACPLLKKSRDFEFDHHVDWVRSLSNEEVDLGTRWLRHIVEAFVDMNPVQYP